MISRQRVGDAGTSREIALDDQRMLITPTAPRWRAILTSATAVTIEADSTWAGSDRLILPFHQWQEGYEVAMPTALACPGGTVATNVTGIGGRLDGTGAVTAGTYILWAVLSAVGGTPLGYGLTRKPDFPGTSGAAAGFGASITVTMTTAGRGHCYTVGARVIIRLGAGLGALYNQGVVTAVAANTVTATLDGVYGGGVTAATVNAVIPAASAVSVIQTDRHAPWVSGATRTTFGAAPFACLGSVEVETAARIVHVRKVGDRAWFENPVTTLTVAAGGALTSSVCLRRWVGRHVRGAYVESSIAVSGGPGGLGTVIAVDGGAAWGQFRVNTDAATLSARGSDVVTPGGVGTTVRAVVTVDGVTTVNYSLLLRGWDEDAY